MIHKKLWRCALVAALTWAACSAGATDGVEPRQLLIGQSIALQGGRNDYAAAVMDGVRAYLEKTNTEGGVHGRQIALRTLDDDNSGPQAEANARRLVQQDKVFLLFGSIEGGPSSGVLQAASELKVPFIGPMAGTPTLREPFQPMVFPVRAEHKDEFRAILEMARGTGVRRVGFMRTDSEVGLLHLRNVKALCHTLGMEFVADLPFQSNLSDARIAAMAQTLAQSQTQLVLNHGSIGAYEKLIRQARAQGLRVTFSAVNSGSTELARHLGELAHGMVMSQVLPSPFERRTPIAREYQDDFARRLPGKPFSYGSLEGYLSAKALVEALRLAGPQPTREGLVGAIESAGSLNLSGLRNSYGATRHQGMSLVELAIVTRDGKFLH